MFTCLFFSVIFESLELMKKIKKLLFFLLIKVVMKNVKNGSDLFFHFCQCVLSTMTH